jgi:hypothetical protein
MGLNQKELDEYFLDDVSDEVIELCEMGHGVEIELNEEEILEYRYDNYAAWQVALIIVGEPEEK